MAAARIQRGTRPHGFVHDWLPLIVVAVVCFLVVAYNVKL